MKHLNRQVRPLPSPARNYLRSLDLFRESGKLDPAKRITMGW
jgi:hypothetical protein